MRIALAVHGRFHGFDLGRALIAQGHHVEIFTNYPVWAAARFDVPPSAVRSFWPHGVLVRLADRTGSPTLQRQLEPLLHQWFGRWVAAKLRGRSFDVVHLWSGVAEETLRAHPVQGALYQMVRGSAHVRAQARLLAAETARTGKRQDAPSEWKIRREEREYELADQILVLSQFALKSFLDEGVAPHKVRVMPLGARLTQFRPPRETVEARVERISSGAPLRVLYVGAVSFQKGMWDLAETMAALRGGPFEFRLVGPISHEVSSIASSLRDGAHLVGKVPQSQLPAHYAWADVFVFPTIQDGYAVVLAQAAAGGLPIITTTNCAGPDFIQDGKTGFIVPIRSAPALVERLQWCHLHRAELATMAREIYTEYHPLDWPEVAADFEALSVTAVRALAAERTRAPRERVGRHEIGLV